MATEEERFGRILNTSLLLIQTGQETIDSVLARYPAQAEKLRPELETAVWLMSVRGALGPRAGAAQASRQRLVRRIQQGRVSRRAPVSPPAGGFWAKIFPSRQHVFQLALAMVVIVALLLTGQTAVLAAQGAIPGDSLYPAKLVFEDAQLALSPASPDRARLYTRFVQRRLAEVEALILQGRYGRIPETVDNYQGQVTGALDALAETAQQDAVQAQALAARLEEVLVAGTQQVSVLSGSLPESAQVEVDRALQVSSQALEAVQTILPGEPRAPAAETLAPGVIPPATSGATPTAEATRLPELTPGPPSATPLPAALPSVTAVPPRPGATLTGTPTPTGTPPALNPSKSSTSTPTPEVKPTKKEKPTDRPKPTQKPKPTERPKPTAKPTDEPKLPKEEKPTDEPKATKEPKPTDEPKPI